jgi:hypothetical protein
VLDFDPVAGHYGDLGPVLGGCDCRRQADTGGAAEHDDSFSLQIHHDASSSAPWRVM